MTLVFFGSAAMVSYSRYLLNSHIDFIPDPLRVQRQWRTCQARSKEESASDKFTGRTLEQAIREPVKNANWHLIRRLKIAGIISKAKEVEEYARPWCRSIFLKLSPLMRLMGIRY